jgi:ribosome-associated protein
VAIMPIRKKSTFVVNPADLEMEFSRAGGKGGQNVNKVETMVEAYFHVESSRILQEQQKQIILTKLAGKIKS